MLVKKLLLHLGKALEELFDILRGELLLLLLLRVQKLDQLLLEHLQTLCEEYLPLMAHILGHLLEKRQDSVAKSLSFLLLGIALVQIQLSWTGCLRGRRVDLFRFGGLLLVRFLVYLPFQVVVQLSLLIVQLLLAIEGLLYLLKSLLAPLAGAEVV